MIDILFWIFKKFSYPFVLMASLPGAAMIPAIIFVGLYFIRRNRIYRSCRILSIFVILVWVIFGVYETGIYFWVQTTTGAPIRVDLILIIPILIWVTIIGIIALAIPEEKTSA